MKTELYYFDVYPKVVPAGETTRITVQPLGRQSSFPASIDIEVKPLNDRNFDFDGRDPVPQVLTLSPDADGCLRFDFLFEMESEYFISFLNNKQKKMGFNSAKDFTDKISQHFESQMNQH